MAAASGLPLVGENRDPENDYVRNRTAYRHAAGQGARIIVGLEAGHRDGDAVRGRRGRFRDACGKPFIPVGETLKNISAIDISGIDEAVAGARIITMCDIDNPLCGPNGAAYVFGPQKGADEALVKVLDENLLHLAGIIKKELGKDIKDIPGAGAAGGMGGGMAAFFGSSLKKGIETVLDTTGFDHLLEGAGLVITGEGKIDSSAPREGHPSPVVRKAGVR